MKKSELSDEKLELLQKQSELNSLLRKEKKEKTGVKRELESANQTIREQEETIAQFKSMNEDNDLAVRKNKSKLFTF